MTIELSQNEVEQVLDARLESRYGKEKLDNFFGWLDKQAEADDEAASVK